MYIEMTIQLAGLDSVWNAAGSYFKDAFAINTEADITFAGKDLQDLGNGNRIAGPLLPSDD